MSDQLDPILRKAGVSGDELHSATLESVAEAISGLPPDEFIPAFALAPTVLWTDGRKGRPDYLELHDADWSIGLADPGNREHLLAVVVAGVLAESFGLMGRIVWLASLLPAVVEVVSVERAGDGLVFTLDRRPHPELPPSLADTVHPDDFAGLVDEIRRAPRSATLASGVTVAFRSS